MKRHAKLTATELSEIWTSYQRDTTTLFVLKHFLETVENPDIAAIIKRGLECSQSHIPQLMAFSIDEDWPAPECKVNLSHPQLNTDRFMLYYIQQMAMLCVEAYSPSIALSQHRQVRDYFTTCQRESIELFQKASGLLKAKGLIHFYL